MRSNQSDYARLLPIRPEVFPNFNADQDVAASTIVRAVAHHLLNQPIDAIIDLGCGTGEILHTMRQQLLTLGSSAIRCVGVDCCAAELDVARKLWSACEFVEQTAEDFMSSIASADANAFRPQNTLVMSVGHTLPHFRNMITFLDNVAQWGAALVLIDFHHEWDDVVRHFQSQNPPPLRKAKQAYQSERESVTYSHLTQTDPEDANRVLRGIETLRDGKPISNRFLTSQLRRSTDWFLAELVRRNYVVEMALSYHAGYGPMSGTLLSRAAALTD